jgi:hypothetical protein
LGTFGEMPDQFPHSGLEVDRNLVRVIGVYLPAPHNLGWPQRARELLGYFRSPL